MEEPKAMPIECVKYYFNSIKDGNLDNRSAIIIDARDQEDYNESHIQGSINIPYDSYSEFIFKEDGKWFLEENYEELLFNQIYIIYCNGGECPLSEDLANIMYDLNFRIVFIYEGGLPEWKVRGYPTETK